MNPAVKKLLILTLSLITMPFLYVTASVILTAIPVNENLPEGNTEIYLRSNGVHIDIVIPVEQLSSEWVYQMGGNENTTYISFGWGDEIFFLNTPTWDQLKIEDAGRALFLNSSSLMHVGRLQMKGRDWRRVKVNPKQLANLKAFIKKSFALEDGFVQKHPAGGYTLHDDFYVANGSYNLFNTCNSWANAALKQSGLRACTWTPYAYGISRLYPVIKH